MDIKKPIALVLAKNHATGLGVVRTIGAAGYTVDYIGCSMTEGESAFVAGSKYVRKAVELVAKTVPDLKNHEILNELYKYSKRHSGETIILFPADDFTASILDVNRSSLEDKFIMPAVKNGTEGDIIEMMKVTVQSEIAERAGFKTPKQWEVPLEELFVPEDVVYPCFCKGQENSVVKSAAEICMDEEELKTYLNNARRRYAERSIIIQEFLDIDNELELAGISFDQDVIISAVAEYKKAPEERKTVTFSGKLVSTEEYAEIVEKAVALMKELHYTGPFTMDINIVGDEIYFNEINLRWDRVNFTCCKSGINLAETYVKAVTGAGIDAPDTTNAVFGKTFVEEDLAWEEFSAGHIRSRQLDQYIDGSEIKLIHDEEDPDPGQIFDDSSKGNLKAEKKKAAKKGIKSLIKAVVLPILGPLKQIVLRYPQMKKENDRDPNSEKPRVIVSGRNYGSNLCIARAVGQAGYEVEILRIYHRKPKLRQVLRQLKPDAYSKHIKAFHTCIYGGYGKRVVNKLLEIADPDRKMLIIPADDLVACIVDDYLEELKDYYILPNVGNKAGEINRMMEKGVQKELALKAGLPVVNSCVIKTVSGKFEIPDTVAYPCFIKPNISKNGSKTKMRRCDSEQELFDALKELAAERDVEMLVEDFVEIGKEYSILGISTKEGAIGPGFFVAEEGGQNEHRGIAVTGKILPCEPRQELIDKIVDFVGSLDFEGLYDVDLIETEDGKMYFVELNMRFGGSGYAVTASGVNLPGMYADYKLMGKPIDMNCKLENTGKRFVSEKVLLESYVKNRLSKTEINTIMDEVDIHFIKDDNDRQAYRHFKKFYTIAALMRQVYKFKDSKDSEFGK